MCAIPKRKKLLKHNMDKFSQDCIFLCGLQRCVVDTLFNFPKFSSLGHGSLCIPTISNFVVLGSSIITLCSIQRHITALKIKHPLLQVHLCPYVWSWARTHFSPSCSTTGVGFCSSSPEDGKLSYNLHGNGVPFHQIEFDISLKFTITCTPSMRITHHNYVL